ncbi:hypothetical protein MMC30_002026 [Trapelia coarctata]|nr:hypothetical protein [Trapelia coarctata]
MAVCTPLAEVPFGPVPDLEHDDSLAESATYEAILRNSMITVRLSDNQSLAEGKPSSNVEPSKKSEHTRVRFEENELSAVAPEEIIIPGHKHAVLHDGEPMAQDTPPLSALTSAGQAFNPDQLSSALHVRTGSIDSSCSSASSAHVDWEVLDKNEEQEQKDEGSDDSTAFLLARLEQENNALAINPKAALTHKRVRSKSRPPSIQQLRKLVNEPVRASLRYSLLPSPPPMTELEFWSALVSNYPQTAQRLPTLTSNKIRNGVPPPLRGVVWMSIAGARDPFLEDEYERLCGESSPYEKLIGKDIGRSFPGVDMFRDPDGEGQKMLGKVLNAFSLWDQEIGYCQGLGFVVGPLLMHMGDKEAFCVLLRLMEHYDLRSCFLPDLSGLHLRIYQFQQLLSQDLPELTQHLENLKLEPLYLSQWFLSFFGVTCPLPMLLRIYDVILVEGASETLMRVALSLMRRNEKKILATTEFEDIMQLLLSRAMWDTYGCNADDLVNDFCGLTNLVTRDALQSLETKFKDAQSEGSAKGSIHSAASRFLGKFWAGSGQPPKSPQVTSPSLSAPSRPISYLRRTPSKQSMASTLNSVESSDTNLSAASTEATSMSRHPSADWVPVKQTLSSTGNVTTSRIASFASKDKDLHSQIEDLLTALGDMQREQNALASELQKEREEREEDRALVQRVVGKIRNSSSLAAIPEDGAENVSQESDAFCISSELADSITELEGHFSLASSKRSSICQTKHQLRDEATRWKEQFHEEAAKSAELSRQLTEKEREAPQLRDELRTARLRIQEAHRDKQRLEKSVQDLRNHKSVVPDSNPDSPSSTVSEYFGATNGLREFKLGRPAASPTYGTSPSFTKRSSSLSTQTILSSTEDHKPADQDALLLDLVNAKTAEAVARQELEEVKGKLDSLRKLLGGTAPSPGGIGHRPSPSSPALTNIMTGRSLQEPPKMTTPTAPSSGGFFSGWGKRTLSTTGPPAPS